MSLDKTNLPDWVQWIAQDADGTWWGYACEPNESDTGWYENEIGDCLRLKKDALNPEWRTSLERVKTV